MSRPTRGLLAALAIWLVVVAATSTTAWIVIDRAGRGAYLTDGVRAPLPGEVSAPVTPPTSVTSTTSSARPRHATGTVSAGPVPSPSLPQQTRVTAGHPSVSRTSPSPGASAAPTPRPPAAGPTPAEDAVTVDGGSVGVGCQGTTLTLRFVTPQDGWAYHVDRSSDSIEVAFREQAGEGESEVQARCSHGSPSFETSSSGQARDASHE